MKHAETLIAELGEKIGLPNLQLDEEGLCSFDVEDEFTLTLGANNQDEVILFALLPDIEKDKRQAGYQLLLQANLLGKGTGDAVLAMTEGDNQPALNSRFSAKSLGIAQLEDKLDKFIKLVKLWRVTIQSLNTSQNEGTTQLHPTNDEWLRA
ncbi:Tir chaperone protein (CesT) [Pseudovibrio sp. Ad46]|uniref:type III secretion system chaperone n=1 Tax=unclassified Pseudovibrio TaxID=2627060 RepID=UPI0007AE4950|nr:MULTISPECIES: type III secretion system chaperone [unclassified Pseudovibrio]KZK88506.1 Tir chaperone protein (CesT) [Pseudovibrio sp. Ad46]KZL03700.1 Tir chaperone protein (CesT) [Pseudovibrio sp. W74]KZL09586.1 Tir chaperone protein (CesT) [Pseudovibrio sp. Ad14]